jgi:hypothetical protein
MSTAQCTSNRKQQDDAPQPECHTCKGRGHLARICPTTIRSLSVQLNRMSMANGTTVFRHMIESQACVADGS